MSTISASTTSTTAFKITTDTTGALVFQTGASPTTAMTLGSDQSVTFAGTPTYSGGTANGVAYLNGSKVLTTGTALVFDGANLGLGVTPSASNVITFQIPSGGVITSSGTQTNFAANAAYNAGWKYVASSYACLYQQSNGVHSWSTAASGTAGNAITFTQSMTLDASGNLILNGTSPVGKLTVSGQSTDANNVLTGSNIVAGTVLAFRERGASAGIGGSSYASQIFVGPAGGNLEIYTVPSTALVFGTAATERARIDSSGNWLLGTTTALTKATVYGSGDQKLSLVSPTGSSTQVGINLSPSMTSAEAAANPAQAAIYATDSNYSANIIFANKTAGALGNALTERARITTGGNFLIGQSSSSHSTFQLEAGNAGAAGAKIGIISLGRSGGDYPWVGYNFAFTGTSGSYIYAGSDYASSIYFYIGGIYTYTANSGTAGNAISYTGGPYVARGGTSWTNASDERLKNITGDIENGLAKVLALRAATYTWKSDEQNIPQVGLIAQNVLGIVPEAVVVPEEEFNGKPETAMGVNYDRLIPVLVAAIQELNAKVVALENK